MAEGAPPPRYGFEPFDCAPALRLEAALERLERRLWLAVYGVVAAILVQAFQPILAALP